MASKKSSLSFDYDSSKMHSKINNLAKKMPIAILMYAKTKSQSIRSSMKINRVWTDRTNQAKATLNAEAYDMKSDSGRKIRITLSHGVQYGIWLELANEQNYAIIIPTIKAEAPNILSDLYHILERAGIDMQ